MGVCVCEGQDGRTQGKTGEGKRRRYRGEEVTKEAGGGGRGGGRAPEPGRVNPNRGDAASQSLQGQVPEPNPCGFSDTEVGLGRECSSHKEARAGTERKKHRTVP